VRMTVASLVVSVLAVVITVLALWYARGQKQAADRSAVAAEQSAAEARRSADAAARSADAADEMANIDRDRRDEEVAEAQRNRVVFTLEYEGGSAYRLRNRGTGTAYGVHVDTAGIGTAREQADFAEFTPDDAYKYLLAAGLGATGQECLTVTWYYCEDRSDKTQAVKLHP
jgi:Flp pilus assembly protein TadB